MIAWRIEHHRVADSTNVLAVQRVIDAWKHGSGPVEGLVISAARQRAGRGQHGRSWESPPGGLYLSAVVEHIPLDLRNRLALIAGVAVARALLALRVRDVSLRWPNDLLLGGRKVGGILCESLARAPHWAAVIGIGLNINTRLKDFSPAMRPYATSVADFRGRNMPITSVRSAVVRELSRQLSGLRSRGLPLLIAAARKLDCLRGQTVRCRSSGREYSGVAQEIGDYGELVLRDASCVHRLASGTILTIDGRPIRP